MELGGNIWDDLGQAINTNGVTNPVNMLGQAMNTNGIPSPEDMLRAINNNGVTNPVNMLSATTNPVNMLDNPALSISVSQPTDIITVWLLLMIGLVMVVVLAGFVIYKATRSVEKNSPLYQGTVNPSI
jgi:hypothetical protein